MGQLAFSDQLATDISIDEASEFISQLETFTGNYTRKGEGQQPLKRYRQSQFAWTFTSKYTLYIINVIIYNNLTLFNTSLQTGCFPLKLGLSLGNIL